MTDQALRRADQLLTELVELVETARAVPMSASCVVPREHLLDLLDDLREVLPPEMDEARRIAGQRDELINEANVQGERVRAQAEHEAAAMRAELDAQAESIIEAARQQAAEMRESAHQYQAEVRAAADALADPSPVSPAAHPAPDRRPDPAPVPVVATGEAEAIRRGSEEYAARTRAQADEYAARLRSDAAGYAERTLADLLAILHRTMATAEQGRQELARRQAGPGQTP